ncbi:Hypothetical predicted protein [Lecanosticta acicola]|uniref:Uncharacterized protein n=1 Tax=Lecanosticta acicola TaxID=111012 RepID=A0AAI8YXU9_9PEZI|nr:Hypothetical predicted protein [Lecanosticta acicola]
MALSFAVYPDNQEVFDVDNMESVIGGDWTLYDPFNNGIDGASESGDELFDDRYTSKEYATQEDGDGSHVDVSSIARPHDSEDLQDSTEEEVPKLDASSRDVSSPQKIATAGLDQQSKYTSLQTGALEHENKSALEAARTPLSDVAATPPSSAPKPKGRKGQHSHVLLSRSSLEDPRGREKGFYEAQQANALIDVQNRFCTVQECEWAKAQIILIMEKVIDLHEKGGIPERLMLLQQKLGKIKPETTLTCSERADKIVSIARENKLIAVALLDGGTACEDIIHAPQASLKRRLDNAKTNAMKKKRFKFAIDNMESSEQPKVQAQGGKKGGKQRQQTAQAMSNTSPALPMPPPSTPLAKMGTQSSGVQSRSILPTIGDPTSKTTAQSPSWSGGAKRSSNQAFEKDETSPLNAALTKRPRSRKAREPRQATQVSKQGELRSRPAPPPAPAFGHALPQSAKMHEVHSSICTIQEVPQSTLDPSPVYTNYGDQYTQPYAAGNLNAMIATQGNAHQLQHAAQAESAGVQYQPSYGQEQSPAIDRLQGDGHSYHADERQAMKFPISYNFPAAVGQGQHHNFVYGPNANDTGVVSQQRFSYQNYSEVPAFHDLFDAEFLNEISYVDSFEEEAAFNSVGGAGGDKVM